MNITGKTNLCIIIGDPVEHSLSPTMHNAGYEALGIDNEFVFVAAKVKVENVGDVARAMRTMGFRGLTCTIPHKMEVMKYLDEIDPIAEKIGAVNTVLNHDGILKGYNTDWLGTVVPLEKYGKLVGKKIALIGAGGVARAMAYGVVGKGARLTIFNRTIEKAQSLADDLEVDVQVIPIESLPEIENYDIILNATNIGMGKNEGISPIPKFAIQNNHIVFDAVYSPYETQLLKDAKDQGATIIHGTEMLLYQGTEQFKLYTGREAPEKVMREILMKTI